MSSHINDLIWPYDPRQKQVFLTPVLWACLLSFPASSLRIILSSPSSVSVPLPKALHHSIHGSPVLLLPAAGRSRHTVHTHHVLAQENLSTKHFQSQQSAPTTSTQQVLTAFKRSALLIWMWLKDRAECVDHSMESAPLWQPELSSAPTAGREEALDLNTFQEMLRHSQRVHLPLQTGNPAGRGCGAHTCFTHYSEDNKETNCVWKVSSYL